jgi:hypothetical protein
MNKDLIIYCLFVILSLIMCSLTGFPNFYAIREWIFNGTDPANYGGSAIVTTILVGLLLIAHIIIVFVGFSMN